MLYDMRSVWKQDYCFNHIFYWLSPKLY